MNIPTKEKVESIKRQYPEGTRIRLIHMDDIQAPPVGTLGTVIGVDGMGDLRVVWDSGCGLSVVLGEDIVEIVEQVC